MADTACFFVIPHQVREQVCPCACLRAASVFVLALVRVFRNYPVPAPRAELQKNSRYRPSQEKAQLSTKGLSGWASSEGQRRSVRSLRCLSAASFAGDSVVFARSSPAG
ncbi:hypothetical protein [uncultured Parabacteroides sp.]|uniref:hypothetical protein n=1 Tax=uncultured Parabacteroides sp. TaxID=512312 RepID=UPI0012F912BA|nr:hypothetical protein [uncultured Parabacteroides sp.]